MVGSKLNELIAFCAKLPSKRDQFNTLSISGKDISPGCPCRQSREFRDTFR
ncbi:hypothetical protein VRK_40070 [Vibrio sp. MEBiC08052]|nr:hypothetical protein VRK_40070 [Vibrio sp. MEBiC08052]